MTIPAIKKIPPTIPTTTFRMVGWNLSRCSQCRIFFSNRCAFCSLMNRATVLPLGPARKSLHQFLQFRIFGELLYEFLDFLRLALVCQQHRVIGLDQD